MPSAPESKVLVITDPYYPDEVAAGHVITRVAEALARDGRVDVFCAQPNYRTRGVRAPWREVRAGVNVQRLPSTTFSNNILPLRLVNIATYAAGLFFRMLFRLRRGDRVLVVTTPPMLPFVALPACRLRGARCALLVHDVFPEALYLTGVLPPGSPLVRLFSSLVRIVYRRMHLIIVIGRDMHALVSRKLGGREVPIRFIPNWAEVDEVRPLPREGNPCLRGLEGKFVVQYSGNMGRTHGIEDLVQAARLLSSDERVHFVFIGDGRKRAWLDQASRDLPNVTVLDYRPREELCLSLNACDVAAIAFVPGMAGVSVPSRMYNVMAAGKPILAVADEDSELALVVREEQIGRVVAPGRPELIAQAVRELAADAEALASMGERARRAAEQTYACDVVLDRFREAVGSL